MKKSSKIYAMYILVLLAALVTACEKTDSVGEVEQDDLETYGDLYDEKITTLAADVHIISLTKVDENLFVSLYRDSESQQYRLGYTDAELSTITPIGNDMSSLVHASDTNAVAGDYTLGHITAYDVDAERNLYLLQYEVPDSNKNLYSSGRKAIFVYDDQGRLQKQIPVDEPKQISFMPAKSLKVQDGRFFIISDMGIHIVDSNGATVKEFAVPSEKAVDAITNREQIVMTGRIMDADLSEDGSLIMVESKTDHFYISAYDVTSNKLLWSKAFLESFSPMKLSVDNDQKQILIASAEKILSMRLDGSELTEVMDFNQYVIGKRNFNKDEVLSPGYVSTQSSGHISVYMVTSPADPQIKEIYQFRKLSGEEKEQRIRQMEQEADLKTTIHLFVPYIEGGIKQKIAQYEDENPHIRVELSYYREDVEEFTPEDFAQYVSLQLLSKKTKWDIMTTQLLPYRDYAGKGYFADIEKVVTDTNINETILPNILEALKEKEQLFVLPARITMRINLADKEAAKGLDPMTYNWNDLLRAAADAKAQSDHAKAWSFASPEGFQLSAAYVEVINAFQRDLLRASSDQAIQKKLIGQFLDIMKAVSAPDEQAIPPEGRPLFHQMLFVPVQFPFYMDVIGQEKELLPGPASQLSGNHTFTLQEGYAINQDSEIKEESLKLMLFLAERAETNNIIFKHSYEALVKQHGTSPGRKEAIEQLQAIVERLNEVRDIDRRLTEALSTTTEQYMNGLTDREGAIRTIQEKLWLYENE